jgi:type IV pilus assembly protein PilY1
MNTRIPNDVTACGALAAQLGISLTPPPAPPTMDPVECARIVIRYYRGADALANNSADRLRDRPFLLHDIFHSAPVVVDPPVDKRYCGLTNQCLPTLYASKTRMA